MTRAVYAGIDVAKAHLDVASSTHQLGRYPNTPAGWRQLFDRLQSAGISHAALESTGGYERPAAEWLREQGIVSCLVKPGSVRQFANSMDILAKNDQIDAKLIARYAESRQPRPLPELDAAATRLRALTDRRRQIVEDRVREQARAETCRDSWVLAHLRRSIAALKAKEARIQQEMRRLIQEERHLRERRDRLCTEVGVGETTAMSVIAYFPEIGLLDRQSVGAIGGLAPYVQQSGPRDGTRRIRAGRAHLRKALYLAALTASRSSPWLAPYYQRLRQAGKPAKVALIACARKLLVRLNAIEKGFINAMTELPPQAASEA